MLTDAQRRLLVLCAIRVEGQSVDWSLIARVASAGSLGNLYDGHIPETSSTGRKSLPVLRAGLTDLRSANERVDAEVRAAQTVGARLTTVLDSDYPANLRLVPDLPPFLFYRGDLRSEDALAVAVVGTRQASEDGLARARRMARELATHGVTVTSGLARGIDTAAHTSALEHGGRTIAVIGTGITRCYPAENQALAERVASQGALVSQFWPTRSPGRDTFPRRNRVTSGLSQGTVVIEASSTSGAKMQARLAFEHGKQVWLLRSLVTQQEWAQKMVATAKAIEIGSVDEVLAHLRTPETVQRLVGTRKPVTTAQLQFDLL